MIYLDTHVVAWLYAGLVERLDRAVMDLINTEALSISPMVILELDYLNETGKTSDPGAAVYQDLQNRIGLEICDKPFARIIFAANSQKWTRDPFDRIIVAQAALDTSLLITKDRLIRNHYPRAFWSKIA
jgi:PIN domain nuclease of toxin-antitoxin system